MFTGLVAGMGEILRLTPSSGETRLSVRALFPAPAWVTGESICVNGACLSVETFDAVSFTACASAETLAVTTLKDLSRGSRVNLEQALALGGRLGGHLVSGHVDCVARIEAMTPAGGSLRVRVRFPEAHAALIVPKGSVALDGVSLTVNRCGRDFLEVNLIPETRRTTTLGAWKAGLAVNLETDLLGKYVASMLAAWRDASPGRNSFPGGELSMDFLRENGY
jgi:riboflavin synthase